MAAVAGAMGSVEVALARATAESAGPMAAVWLVAAASVMPMAVRARSVVPDSLAAAWIPSEAAQVMEWVASAAALTEHVAVAES